MPLIRKDSNPQVAPAAAGGLTSPSSEERWTAARALTGPEATAPLAQALATEEDPRVREAILTSLARIGTPQSAAAILPSIRSDDAAVRTSALDALRAIPQAATHVSALLTDADPDVRLLATDLVREMDPAAAIPMLCELIDREDEANVCAAAVEVLTEIGDESAAPALKRCAARCPDDGFLGFAIKVALQRLDPSAKDHRSTP